jgi:CRP-like cAMP-binding protein
MVDLSSIETADILRGLTKADLIELGEVACEQEFKRGDHLFKRGEEAETFFIATRGRFALTVALRVFDGHVGMAVEDKVALDAFGWSSLVEPHTSIYSGYCIEDGAVVAFPRDRLEALMTTNSRLGAKFLHNLNELIGARMRVAQNLWLDEVSESMARVRHWTETDLTVEWSEAVAGPMADPTSHPIRSWIRRHAHLHTEE